MVKLTTLESEYDKLYKLEKPSEDELQQLEDTEKEIDALKEQLSEKQVDEPDNKPANIIDFKEDAGAYKVPKGEEGHVHIKMFTGNRFDPTTGKEVANYIVQKFNQIDFKNFEAQSNRLGFKYGFLHKPQGFKSTYEK